MANSAPSGSRRGGRRPRVVIVEDHHQLREHLVALLEMSGYDVVAAADSAAAGLEAVNREGPDLAVLDNRMPDAQGVELAAVLAEETPSVGVLIHSGAITAEEVDRALRAGALEVVRKDVRARALVDALRRHAGRSRDRR